MPVARHLTRVVKVIQHAKLQRQLVLVRRNVLPIHRQARIAIPDGLATLLQIAKDLIVSPVLLDDVDHMLDRPGPEPASTPLAN